VRLSNVMNLETLRDLYVHELKDLYSAEHQIIKALPKMKKATSNRRLAAAFNQHLEQTRRQAKRLEQILKRNKESTRGPKCEGMEGLLKEGDEVISDAKQDDVRDAGLIAAAQRVEHYEIAGYGCARTYAELLRDKAGARLLDTTLREEAATDKKLTSLAKSVINLRAKKAPKRNNGNSRNGLTEAIKRAVQKVTG
jgi:ferritin-like metal-binding protein YciE